MSPLRPVPSAGVETGSRCALGVCDGSGWILDEDSNTAHPCDCRERRVNKAVTGRLGTSIPKRLREVSFERNPLPAVNPDVVRHVRAFMRRIDENLGEGAGLWFHGDVGTGKTSLALLVCKAAIESGRSVAIYSTPLLLADLKSTFERDASQSYLELFHRLCAVDLLLLDDLGAEKQTDWVLEQLYSLVNERWQNQRSILVTTNSPDPSRDVTLRQLHAEISALSEIHDRGWPLEELRELASRLERTATKLESVGVASDDAVPRLRRQVGSRTVSRLIHICDDPIPMMGTDLRMAAGGG
jgi:DNA replication protein DnaC